MVAGTREREREREREWCRVEDFSAIGRVLLAGLLVVVVVVAAGFTILRSIGVLVAVGCWLDRSNQLLCMCLGRGRWRYCDNYYNNSSRLIDSALECAGDNLGRCAANRQQQSISFIKSERATDRQTDCSTLPLATATYIITTCAPQPLRASRLTEANMHCEMTSNNSSGSISGRYSDSLIPYNASVAVPASATSDASIGAPIKSMAQMYGLPFSIPAMTGSIKYGPKLYMR
jgi:hypothetical protein